MSRDSGKDILEAYISTIRRNYGDGDSNVRSAIRKEGNTYVIDTICDSDGERIYGVRANLKQRSQEVIVKGIGALLDGLGKNGNPGTLTDTIERRRKFLVDKSVAA